MSNIETRINSIKIKDLPESSILLDSDIVLKDNSTTTNKFKLSTLIQFIKNHTEILNFFAHQSTINEPDGIAPLDLNRKIPSDNINYGKTAGTVYKGSEGAALETTVNAHALDTSNPHDTTKFQIGLSNVDNTQDINKPVSAAQRNAIDSAYENSNLYTDTKINALVNGAPETLDTLKEVSDAISKNKTVVDALNAAIGTKANQTELNTHTTNATIHITSGERTNYNDANTKKHTHGNKITIDKLSEADGILMFDGERIQGGGSEYIHPKPTRANTTSSSSTTHGGTFSVLDVINSNAEGHVTGVNTKTITLPAAQTSVTGSSGSCTGNSASATKATNDANGNVIINQKTSTTEPTNQKVGDYWLLEY